MGFFFLWQTQYAYTPLEPGLVQYLYLRAVSTVVMRRIRIAETGVRFSHGPQVRVNRSLGFNLLK
jgi:hypothetical protein